MLNYRRIICLILAILFTLSGAALAEDEIPVYSPVILDGTPDAAMTPLPNPYKINQSPFEPNPNGYSFNPEEGLIAEYRDSTISVRIQTRILNNTKVFFTWIQIVDPGQLRTIVAHGENSPIKMASRVSAVVAIDGDWFWGHKEGVIYRNGELMRSPKKYGNYDALFIDTNGDFHILRRPSLEDVEPYRENVAHSFLFGPALVIDGVKQEFPTTRYGSGQGMGLGNRAQRQAICQMDKLSYLFITTEGAKDSKGGGYTMEMFAQLAYDVGAKNAYNLDGANSACLIFNGEKLNRYKKGGLRYITDLVYFVTAEAHEDPVPETPESVLE